MRAKEENSSTMRPISPTWRMIVSVHCSKTCLSVWISRAVFPAQTFGRKLDRRQRILDFMGDAPRDIGPGRIALRRDEFGDVVEGHDMAVLGVIRALGRDPHDEAAILLAGPEIDLAFGRTGGPARSPDRAHGTKSGSASPRRLADEVLGSLRQEQLSPNGSPSIFVHPGSRPITPALTPASMASVKRRRSSSC